MNENYDKSILMDGENVLWDGKPNKKSFVWQKIMNGAMVALIWGGFDFFMLSFILKMGEIDKGVMIFLIAFFGIHLIPVWMWLANVVTANKIWKNMYYIVTDRRIIFQFGLIAEEYNSLYYKDITNVSLKIGVFDKIFNTGDIILANANANANNTTISRNSSIIDIENPREIYKKIQKIALDIQTDIHYPNALRPDTNEGFKTKYKG